MTTNINICNGCGSLRPKGKQWFYTYPDIAVSGVQVKPIDVRCPDCAGPERVAERAAQRSKNLNRGRQ